MSRRNSYSDSFTGEADKNIRAILEDESSEENISKIKRLLLNVIKNELTEKQQKIVTLYYFRMLDTVAISEMLGVTPQAVSSVMSRARLRIYRVLKYYL